VSGPLLHSLFFLLTIPYRSFTSQQSIRPPVPFRTHCQGPKQARSQPRRSHNPPPANACSLPARALAPDEQVVLFVQVRIGKSFFPPSFVCFAHPPNDLPTTFTRLPVLPHASLPRNQSTRAISMNTTACSHHVHPYYFNPCGRESQQHM